MMKRVLVFAVVLLTGLSACKKGDSFDSAKQTQVDDAAIQAFITSKSLTAQKHNSGLYYVISTPGTGNLVYTGNTAVTVKYTGRFLNGTIFDSGTVTYPLGGFIDGWKAGVPLIQKGGKIRLLIPSLLAYAQNGQGSIPPNTVLDFDIELINAVN